MASYELSDSWTEVDLLGGFMENRGPATIECSEVAFDGSPSYVLLAPAAQITAADWGSSTAFCRKSQTSSGDAKAILFAGGGGS